MNTLSNSGKVTKKLVISIIALIYGLFQWLSVGPLIDLGIYSQRSIHLGFALVLLFLIFPTKNKKTRILDYLYIGACVISIIFVLTQQNRFLEDPYTHYSMDIILGVVLLIVLLEAARRTIGLIMPIMALLFVLYALFGSHIPGTMGFSGMSFERLISSLYTSTSGVWGVTIAISATIISAFVIFGQVILKTGASDLIMLSVSKITGKSVGGPAKLGVISSGLFGSITGSAAANVAVVGSVSIPLMKSLGYKPAMAGGIEAAASTGGQMLPPVMGAAAFVMAEYLNVPYSQIMIAGIIPGVLYYIGMYFSVHFAAVKFNLGRSDASFGPWKKIIKIDAFLCLVVPFIFLIYMIFQGYSAEYSCFWTVLVTIAIYMAFGLKRVSELKKRFLNMVSAFKESGEQIVTIAILAGTAQIVILLINSTGIGAKFANTILSLGGTSLFSALIMTMILCLILGMGMPAVASYILTAAIAAVSLIKLGVDPLPAHMFIFWYACISAITPPVCAAVFVAAPMAGAKFLATALQAMKVGAIAFILPFLFIIKPGYLMSGDVGTILFTALLGVLLTIAIPALLTNQYFSYKIKFFSRLILIAIIICLVSAVEFHNIIGIVGFLIFSIYTFLYSKKQALINNTNNASLVNAADSFSQKSNHLSKETI